MSLWRWLFGCRHDEMIRERDERGGYWVRCSACGYATWLIRRYGQEGIHGR